MSCSPAVQTQLGPHAGNHTGIALTPARIAHNLALGLVLVVVVARSFMNAPEPATLALFSLPTVAKSRTKMCIDRTLLDNVGSPVFNKVRMSAVQLGAQPV